MDIHEQISAWGGETVILHADRPSSAWIIIAVHSTHLGPGTGGTRMRHYRDLDAAVRDALSLAEGMTYKFATADFPRGGAKAVIALPAEFDPAQRPQLLRRYGALIHQLGGLFQTGPDVGTSPADMDVIAETGAPFVHSRTPAAGGAGDSGPATALGVFEAIVITCETLFGDASLRDKRVLVQGAGSVGGRLMASLLEAGAIVLGSDVDRTAINRFQGVQWVEVDNVYATDSDIFAPCALGGVLNSETIPDLRCRAVVGAANNQLATPDDAESLRRRGILYAPDFVVNFGGALAITGQEALGWSQDEALRQVRSTVRSTLTKVFEIADADGVSTTAAARRLAEARLSSPSVSSFR